MASVPSSGARQLARWRSPEIQTAKLAGPTAWSPVAKAHSFDDLMWTRWHQLAAVSVFYLAERVGRKIVCNVSYPAE